jgi:hypothetical protein
MTEAIGVSDDGSIAAAQQIDFFETQALSNRLQIVGNFDDVVTIDIDTILDETPMIFGKRPGKQLEGSSMPFENSGSSGQRVRRRRDNPP